jgi:hypothetical protein
VATLTRLVPYPDNLRTVEVRYSERELRRLAGRIRRDLREHEAVGFDLSSWGPDLDTNTVRIELITTRTDHAEYFAARYGPVTTQVIATEPTIAMCTQAEGFEISGDGMRLTLGWSSSGDAKPGGVELREYEDRVEVGVVERLPSDGWTDDDVGYTSEVALSAPLGDRAVIDAGDGRRLRQRGPSPGEPPCPPDPPPGTMVEELVAARGDMGLRNDRAFVRRLLRRERRYTPAEVPFVDAWERLEFLPRLERYFARHRDEFGGREIRGRYPGRPYVLARFTRRLAFHRRNLARIVPVRVARARFTEADLFRLAERIDPGFVDGWGDAGILVRRASVERNRIVVEVVTARDDYAAVLRRRFGAAVRAVLVGRRHECF